MIPDLVRHTRVLAIVVDIFKVRAAGIGFGELAVIENWDGRTSLGQVVELSKRTTGVSLHEH